jgi:hypothetical protein
MRRRQTQHRRRRSNQAGDRLMLRRFVAAKINADIDRGDQLWVTLMTTLPGATVMSPAGFRAALNVEEDL